MRLPDKCPRCQARQAKRSDYSNAVPHGEQSSIVIYECGCTLTWKREANTWTQADHEAILDRPRVVEP